MRKVRLFVARFFWSTDQIGGSARPSDPVIGLGTGIGAGAGAGVGTGAVAATGMVLAGFHPSMH